MTKLKALQSYPYDNKQRQVGDVFDARDEDVDALVLPGLAEYVDKPGRYQDRAVKADDDDAPPAAPPAHRKREYRRRDMRADD